MLVDLGRNDVGKVSGSKCSTPSTAWHGVNITCGSSNCMKAGFAQVWVVQPFHGRDYEFRMEAKKVVWLAFSAQQTSARDLGCVEPLWWGPTWGQAVRPIRPH